MRKYYNSFFLLSTLLIYIFPFLPQVHKPIIFFLLLPIALFINGFDRELIKIYYNKINLTLLIGLFIILFLKLYNQFINSQYILLENQYIYLINYLALLCFIFSFIVGVNIRNVIKFNSLFICNLLILIVILIQNFDLNFLSYKFCQLLNSKYLIGVNYCFSYTEFKGFSLLTTEPSFGAMQLMYLIILNIFFLTNFNYSVKERNILIFFLIFFLFSFIKMNSELATLFFFIGSLFFTYKIFIILEKKFNFNKNNFFLFLIIFLIGLMIFLLGFIINYSFFFLMNTKCLHEIYTLLPRIFYYFIFFENLSFSFLQHNSLNFFEPNLNNSLIEVLKNIPYFNYCNSLLERTIVSMPLKIIPQPIFLKFIYFVNIYFLSLFLILLIKIIIKKFKFNILKILILIYLIICLTLQGSFLMVYTTLLLQVYLNDKN